MLNKSYIKHFIESNNKNQSTKSFLDQLFNVFDSIIEISEKNNKYGGNMMGGLDEHKDTNDNESSWREKIKEIIKKITIKCNMCKSWVETTLLGYYWNHWGNVNISYKYRGPAS